ncbi:MAG TPA: hypothetical protein VGA01_06895 [Candidatus Binatia bacterium]|nr:hypothetical protein [Verrucomicrobiae bacterium]
MKIRQLLSAIFFPRRYLRLRKAQRRVLASQGQALDRWPAPTDPKAKLASYLTDDHTEPMKMRRELKGKWRRHR